MGTSKGVRLKSFAELQALIKQDPIVEAIAKDRVEAVAKAYPGKPKRGFVINERERQEEAR